MFVVLRKLSHVRHCGSIEYQLFDVLLLMTVNPHIYDMGAIPCLSAYFPDSWLWDFRDGVTL